MRVCASTLCSSKSPEPAGSKGSCPGDTMNAIPLDQIEQGIRPGVKRKQFRRNVQTLSEFPWLWAIKQDWNLIDQYFKIVRLKDAELNVIMIMSVERFPTRVGGLWVHGFTDDNGVPREFVKKLYGPDFRQRYPFNHPNATWLDFIAEMTSYATITHIVIQNAGIFVIKPDDRQITFDHTLKRSTK